MKVADEVWTSVALLHRENPTRADFTIEEIKQRARRENWPIRPGFGIHASYHCLANKPANPANHRMLFEDSRGRKRLYRLGDAFHSERENGKIHPDKQDLPAAYQPLVDWYEASYSKDVRPPSFAKGLPQAPAANGIRVDPNRLSQGKKGGVSSKLPEMQSSTTFVGSAGTVIIPDSLRKELGIKEGTCVSVYREADRVVLQPVTDEFIRSLVGCCKGEDSLVEAREREHRMEK
jgi:AbrB family looped-hinge helix DNA binding protein